MSAENEVGRVMIPLIHQLASIADEVRPEVDYSSVVGEVTAAINAMFSARSLEDDERTERLEALIMSLATWIYRDRKADFVRFVEESAEIATLGAMVKMMGDGMEGTAK